MLVGKPKKRFFSFPNGTWAFPLAGIVRSLWRDASMLAYRRLGFLAIHTIAPVWRNVTVMLAIFELLFIFHALIAGNVDVVLRN
jgi:hypothetical protein